MKKGSIFTVVMRNTGGNTVSTKRLPKVTLEVFQQVKKASHSRKKRMFGPHVKEGEITWR
jgi:hypothetical protein